MAINVKNIKRLFGDRVLVERLDKPKKVGSFYIPESHRQEGRPQTIWWGRVKMFGLDSKAKEAYDIQEGDIIGLEALAADCTTLTDEETGAQYVWAPDEFIAAKDDGTMAGHYERP